MPPLPRGKQATPESRSTWEQASKEEREKLLTRAGFPSIMAHHQWGNLPAPARRELVDIIAREQLSPCFDLTSGQES